MRFYFNNCLSRDHAALYGIDAFYDLYRSGKQAEMATNLKPNDECVVATTAPNGEITFDWFTFTHEDILPMPDEPGTRVRVLFGKRIRTETMPKSTAARTTPYSVFFNVNGHFKRPSVIVPKEHKG
ncbi:MAG: hypothetical protein ABSC14_01585 [Desulfomonilia bacterium]|jgi:hypothetical protein